MDIPMSLNVQVVQKCLNDSVSALWHSMIASPTALRLPPQNLCSHNYFLAIVVLLSYYFDPGIGVCSHLSGSRLFCNVKYFCWTCSKWLWVSRGTNGRPFWSGGFMREYHIFPGNWRQSCVWVMSDGRQLRTLSSACLGSKSFSLFFLLFKVLTSFCL